MLSNKPAIETIADTLVEKREMYGNEVVALLKSLPVTVPDVDPACGGDMASDLTSGEGAELAKPEAPLVARPAGTAPAPPAVRAAATAAASWRSTGCSGSRSAAAIVGRGSSTRVARSIPGLHGRRGSRPAAVSAPAKQIADHISRRTTASPTANQLVDVIPKGPAVSSGGQTIPIPLLAERGPKGKILPDRVEAADERETRSRFSLCGLGASCANRDRQGVDRAAPDARAPARSSSLRLYTFKLREEREADRGVHAASRRNPARLPSSTCRRPTSSGSSRCR